MNSGYRAPAHEIAIFVIFAICLFNGQCENSHPDGVFVITSKKYQWQIDAVSHKTEVYMAKIKIARGYAPGTIGRVAELHGVYYHDHWNFGLFFEAKVAVELAEFLKRYDDKRDGFWTVSVDGCVEGAIAIDGIHGESEGAHLRWFIISDALRGKGAGNQLINTAIGFCRRKSYNKIYLWTFEGLGAARHLYQKVGFRLVEAHKGVQWGTAVNEQRLECSLPAPE